MVGSLAEKHCSKCGEIKPVSAFYKKASRPGGLDCRCKECSAEYSRQYHIKNKEKRNEYSRQYAEKHREERREYARQYYAEHKEEEYERHKQFRKDHPELCKKLTQQWRKNHPNYNKQWHAANRDKHNAQVREWELAHPEEKREMGRRRRSREAELPFDFYAKDEKFALEYWDSCCAVCGKKLDIEGCKKGHITWSFDHWISVADRREDNPGTVPSNMLPMCQGKGSCNGQKHNSDPIKWLHRKYTPEQANEILSRINKYFDVVKNMVPIEETNLGDWA